MTGPLLGRVDAARELARLRPRRVNYSAAEIRPTGWTFDTHRSMLPPERPGSPEPGGTWELACRLVERYEFSEPTIIRAVYDPRAPLHGRDMLLEGRFYGLRFYLGVRVTGVTDETRADGDRVWGWSYETLEGHLERGRVDYAVVKHRGSGRVEFVITAYSRQAPGLGPVTRLGWFVFGRRMQLRFYRGCGRRLDLLVRQAQAAGGRLPTPPTADGLVLAPADTRVRRVDRLALHRTHPG